MTSKILYQWYNWKIMAMIDNSRLIFYDFWVLQNASSEQSPSVHKILLIVVPWTIPAIITRKMFL